MPVIKYILKKFKDYNILLSLLKAFISFSLIKLLSYYINLLDLLTLEKKIAIIINIFFLRIFFTLEI